MRSFARRDASRSNCNSCCDVRPLSCWADKAGGAISDLRWRDTAIKQAVPSVCGQNCGGVDYTACCHVADPLNVDACDNKTPCESFPAGPLCQH